MTPAMKALVDHVEDFVDVMRHGCGYKKNDVVYTPKTAADKIEELLKALREEPAPKVAKYVVTLTPVKNMATQGTKVTQVDTYGQEIEMPCNHVGLHLAVDSMKRLQVDLVAPIEVRQQP